MSRLSEVIRAANVDGLSGREIARRSGDKVSVSTVNRVIKGDIESPSDDVLLAFTEAIPSLTLEFLRALTGSTTGDSEPWVLPEEANRLTRRQREVIESLIRVMTTPDVDFIFESPQGFTFVVDEKSWRERKKELSVGEVLAARASEAAWVNKGGTSVTSIVGPKDDDELGIEEQQRAARAAPSAGRARRKAQDEAGEESQA